MAPPPPPPASAITITASSTTAAIPAAGRNHGRRITSSSCRTRRLGRARAARAAPRVVLPRLRSGASTRVVVRVSSSRASASSADAGRRSGSSSVSASSSSAQPRRRVLARDLAQHAARRVEVAALGRRLALGDLGREVADRPHHHPGLGHRRRVLRAGDPEVGQLRAVVLVEQDVAGLDVAVDDPGRVHVRERAEQLAGQPLGVGQRAAVAEAVAQAAAGDVRHHQVGPVLLDAEVEDLDDVRVRERGGRARLALEAREPALVVGERVRHQLDRDLAVQRLVARQPHGRHAARAEVAHERVAAAGQRGPLGRPHQPLLPLALALALPLAGLGRLRGLRRLRRRGRRSPSPSARPSRPAPARRSPPAPAASPAPIPRRSASASASASDPPASRSRT